jgi:hypothetical protein
MSLTLDEEQKDLLDRASKESRNQDLLSTAAPIRPVRQMNDDSFSNLSRTQVAGNRRTAANTASRVESKRLAAADRLAVFYLQMY